MPYTPQYIIDLNSIISDIQDGRLTGAGQAHSKFQTYVTQVKNIGRYSVGDWPSVYTDRVYEFGGLFSTIDPTVFLTSIENELLISNFAEREILFFFKSEILWNFENPLRQEQFLSDLLLQYVTNAEFLHSLGHLKIKKKLFLEGLEYYTQAVRINPKNNRFISTKYDTQIVYIEDLIENEKYDEARTVTDDIINSGVYKSENFIIHNWFVFLQKRIKDYNIQEEKHLKKEMELRNIISTELLSERKRTIELLGLFTAIIAFIFTTVSVAKTFSYEQAINFTVCLGLVLIEFAVTISIMFHDNKTPFYTDIRLYIATVVGIVLYFILSTTTLIHECFKHFPSYH